MKKIVCFLIILFVLISIPIIVSASPYTEIIDKDRLAELLEGEGVEISNVKITGNSLQVGRFENASNILGFKNINDGIILSTGVAKDMFVPATSFLSTSFGTYGASSIFDEVYIEFDAVSEGSFISFQYIFASEEFDQPPTFNDLITIEVNGKNIALIPDSENIVCINSLRNTKYHYDNYMGTDIGYLGYTPLLSCQANVTPNAKNHFKISVKDLGDPIFDSALFIKANSLSNKKAPKPETNPDPPSRGYDIPVNFDKEISALKITLANGDVLNDIKIQNNTISGISKGILLANDLIVTIDDELLHGAILEVEYKITLEYYGMTPCYSYTIKDFKDDKFIYRNDQKLLTENVTNSYYGWKIADSGYIKYTANGDSTSPVLMPGNKVEKKIVLTKVLSASLSDDFYTYENSAELELESLRSYVSKEVEAMKVNLLPPFGRPYYVEICFLTTIISIILLCFICYKKFK